MFLVKPKNGARVRHDMTKEVLSDEGAKIVSVTSYWARRQAAGEVEITPIKQQEEIKKTSSKKGDE